MAATGISNINRDEIRSPKCSKNSWASIYVRQLQISDCKSRFKYFHKVVAAALFGDPKMFISIMKIKVQEINGEY